jgi:hypothetical protein
MGAPVNGDAPPAVPAPADSPGAPAAAAQDTAQPAAPAPTYNRWAKVDALFAGEPPPPPEDANARILQLRQLLWVALPLVLLGIPCCTGVPGAMLTMWAWLVADEQMTRVENGEYKAEDAATIMRLRAVARGAMVVCVVSLIIQIFLLSTPFYEALWQQVASVIARLPGR